MGHAFHRQCGCSACDSAEDAITEAQERAIQQWARNLVLRNEVDELAQEIYDAGGMILAAVEVYRAKTGRVPSYHETSFLRRLRELISEVENAR